MPATPAPITTTRGGSKGGCATFLLFLVLPQVCALWAPWQALHVEGGGASVAARGGGPPMASLFGGADVALPEVKPFFWRPPCFFAGAAPFDPFGAAGAAPVLGGIGPCCGSIVSWACSAGSAVVIDQTDQLRRVPAVYCGRARSFSIRARGHSKLRHTSLCFCNFFYPSGRRRAGPSPARDALEMYLRRAARCRALTQPASVKAIAAVYAAAGLGAQLNSVSKGPS